MDMLDYARRGRTAWWLYLVTIGLALLLAALFGTVLITGLMLMGKLPSDLTQQMTTPSRPDVFFATVGEMFSSILAGLVLAARLVQQKRFTDIVGAWSWRMFGLGAGAWAIVSILAVAVDMAIAPSGFRVTVGPGTLPLAGLALVSLAPQAFTEEFVFRGFLTQGFFLAFKRPWPAAVISGVVFGLMHIPNGAPQAASATVFGILTALIAIRYGGIALTFGLHLVNNLFGAVVVVSAGDVFHGLPGVLSQATPNLMWWDVATSTLGLIIVTRIACSRVSREF